METVVIRKKDVERLGKELLIEINDIFNDEYILSEFEEMKNEKIKFVENLAKKGDDIEGIFYTLNSLYFDMEINEDLYFKKRAFLDIFKVFNFGYTYLNK